MKISKNKRVITDFYQKLEKYKSNKRCEKYISMYHVMITMGLYTERDYYSQFTPILLGVFRVAHFYSHSILSYPYFIGVMVPPERLELPTHWLQISCSTSWAIEARFEIKNIFLFFAINFYFMWSICVFFKNF